MSQKTAENIQHITQENIDVIVQLGSGLNHIGFTGELITSIPYEEIMDFGTPTTASHEGRLDIVRQNEKKIAICRGRYHLYEGYNAQQITRLIYALSIIGAKKLIVCNAAGALNSSYQPGDIMCIQDHLNMTGVNPLVGKAECINSIYSNSIFVDMSDAYAYRNTKPELLLQKYGVDCHLGIYAGVLGPSLETSAERRALRILGADAVGMSTVLEVIAARHCNLSVLGFSAITNMALGDDNQQKDTIEDVLLNAHLAAEKLEKIIALELQTP